MSQSYQIIPKTEQAFRGFFDDHYGPLVSFAAQYVQDRDDAEEIVQEVFANLWAKADHIQIQHSVKSLLFTSVRNACLNYLKHQKVHRNYEQHQLYVSKDHSDAVPLEYDELKGRLNAALDTIAPKCREIFEMSRFEGKRYKEIAEELGLSLKTVENQMGKALKILKDALGDYLIVILWLFTHGGKF